MNDADDKAAAQYTFDAQGQLHRNGRPVPKGFKRPRSPAPTNADGTKATRKDTEALARGLAGLSQADAAQLVLSMPHIRVDFIPDGMPVTPVWMPFRIRAYVSEGVVVSASAE